MNRNKKILHKVTANVLGITLASVMAAGMVIDGAAPVSVYAAQQKQSSETNASKANVSKIIYLDGKASALEKADGSTKEKAVNSLETALKLAGTNGTISVCGTVTISTEKKITIPSGVVIKKSDGFKGSLIKITGTGKLTVTGGNLTSADVDTSSAKAGSDAFKKEEISEKKKASVDMPGSVTLGSQEEWKSYSFKGFTGDGTFAWKEQTAPSVYQSSVKVVFTPKDVKKYDYSGVSGWDAASEKVVRTVEVTIESLKPEKEEVVPEEKPVPEKEKASVNMPEEVKIQKAADWIGFDFAGAGFTGDGTFAWESQAEPVSYEAEAKVVFTPSDREAYDYSQVPGWNEETGRVVRTVKVMTEELKEPEKPESKPEEKPENKPETKPESKPEEKPENKPETKPEEKPDDSKKPEEEKDTPSQSEDTDKKENQASDNKNEKPSEPESQKPDKDDKKDEDDQVKIEYVDDKQTAEKEETSDKEKEEVVYSAEQGKKGEEASEMPEAVPVGSLIDESGVQVYGDFIPFYVDLQVSYNEAVNELPDAGIGEILSAYEMKLWDLKEDQEYKIPEGRKVKVMIPLPENANCYSDLAIAHYLGNNEYEYFVFDRDGETGNMSIEESGGKEYLTFETASFSPFNVGGHQIVGPGTSSGGHKAPSGTSTQDKGNSGTNAGGSGTPSVGQSTNNNSSSQNKKNENTQNNNSNSTKIIHTVKTGDESPILIYVAIGAAALILAAGAVVVGKKKK